MIRRLITLADDRRATNVHLLLLFLGALFRAGATLALIPLLAGLFSDEPRDALPWLGLLTGTVLVGWIVEIRLYRSGFDIGMKILRTAETRVLDRLERVPLTWLDADRRVEARRALTSAGREICQGMAYLVTPMANALLTPILIGVGLAFVAWPLAVAALLAVPLLLGALWVSGAFARAADDAYARASDEVATRIVELAQHQAALRAAGRAGPEGSALGSALARQRRAALRLLGFGAPGHLLFGVASQLTLLALAATAAVLFLDGTLTAPVLVALIVVAVRFLEPFTTFGDLAQAVQSLRGTVARVVGVLDAPVLPVTEDLAPQANPAVLAFDDVSFTYDGTDRPAVSHVSFTVQRGGTTAIVGPSGSGKSTLLALAARLHDAGAGTVRVQGRDLRSYDPLDLAAHYAVVHQSVYLFEGTLRDNVLLGRRDADDDALASAATRAGLDEVVARLPEGWSTRVGEGGATLSGGERQRVGLARALLKDAPLLLLDEVTSALDTGNEQAVVAALASTAEHRATVIIAHRLDTIIGADQIVFLDGGRVLEIGSPNDLIAADGHFARYWAQRREASGWHLVGVGASVR